MASSRKRRKDPTTSAKRRNTSQRTSISSPGALSDCDTIPDFFPVRSPTRSITDGTGVVSPGAQQVLREISLSSFRSPPDANAHSLGLPSLTHVSPSLQPKIILSLDEADAEYPSFDSSVSSIINTLFPSQIHSHLHKYFSNRSIRDLFQPQYDSIAAHSRYGSVISGCSLILEAPTSAGKSLVAYLLILRHFSLQLYDNSHSPPCSRQQGSLHGPIHCTC
ncbi:hypothetical protein GEMRC1_004508 [Eukaryota sp. GEM-RC1]